MSKISHPGICPVFDAGVERSGLPINVTRWPVFDLVIQKPRIAQHAGSLGFDNVIAFDFQVDVVADATTECAGGVLDDLGFRAFFDGAHRVASIHIEFHASSVRIRSWGATGSASADQSQP